MDSARSRATPSGAAGAEDIPSPHELMKAALGVPCEPKRSMVECGLLLLISSAAGYERRRRAIRSTYLSDLDPRRVSYRFLLGAPTQDQRAALDKEDEEHGDLLQLDGIPESYETLWPKLVGGWRWSVATHDFRYWMHADDDSYVRLGGVLAWLREADAQAAPTAPAGLYAGYMWDGTDGRRTVPVRDAAQKSYMPRDQWEEDTYPAFASGCGFLLSRGLVDELVRRSPSFSFFRLIDVPVGICLAQLPADSFRLVHIPEVRAYRPLPLYRSDTLVQHYMQPEEFHQYHQRALADAAGAGDAADGDADAESERRAAEVYDLLRAARCMR